MSCPYEKTFLRPRGEPAIDREVAQRRRLFPNPFVQPRHVVVRVRQARIRGQCGTICFDGVGRTVQVLERDSKVERRRGVIPVLAQCLPVVPLSLLHHALFVQQPAQVHVRASVMRVQLERPPVGVARLDRGDGFELVSQLIPTSRIEIPFSTPRRLGCPAGDRRRPGRQV